MQAVLPSPPLPELQATEEVSQSGLRISALTEKEVADQNMSYWLLEFVRVFLGYIILMYFWPSVVFRKKLSGKSLTFRFAFCSTVSVLLINTLVLGLGLIHILKGWIVVLIFYGILLISIFKEKAFRKYFFSQGKKDIIKNILICIIFY